MTLTRGIDWSARLARQASAERRAVLKIPIHERKQKAETEEHKLIEANIEVRHTVTIGPGCFMRRPMFSDISFYSENQ